MVFVKESTDPYPERFHMRIKDPETNRRFRSLAEDLKTNMTALVNQLIEYFFSIPLVFDRINPLSNLRHLIDFLYLIDVEKLNAVHKNIQERDPLTKHAKKSHVLASMITQGLNKYIQENEVVIPKEPKTDSEDST